MNYFWLPFFMRKNGCEHPREFLRGPLELILPAPCAERECRQPDRRHISQQQTAGAADRKGGRKQNPETDGREKPLAGCIAALYRFVTYGAEAVFVSALSSGDRGRFGALREPILNALATGRPLWPRGEPPSLHHMLHDEPQS